MELIELPSLFISAPRRIDASRVDAAVPKDVGQTDDILEFLIVGTGEQVAQVVRKDHFRRDLRQRGKFFEHLPDVAAIQRLSRPRHKDRSSLNALFLAVCFQLPSKSFRDQDASQFALVLDNRLPRAQAFDRDRVQLADAEPQRAQPAMHGKNLYDYGRW